MANAITGKSPIVDRGFAEKFLVAVDRPMDYGVYHLINDWWETATQDAIDQYMHELYEIPGAEKVLRERFIPEPIDLDSLKPYTAGTLGHAYHSFIVKNDLIENFGTDYRAYQKELLSSGKLKKMPEEMVFLSVRGTQLHDFMHVLTGYDSSIEGELALASFYLSQTRSPYHAIRLAVVMSHTAFVSPSGVTPSMDAFVDGWHYGRNSKNINFEHWEARLDEQLSDLQEEMNLRRISMAA